MVYDPPGGQWSKAPAFPSGGGGLVFTVDDYYRFARMLLAGGRLPDGSRLLSRPSVEAMTSDHIGAGPGMFTAAYPPPAVIQDFWTSLYAALGG